MSGRIRGKIVVVLVACAVCLIAIIPLFREIKHAQRKNTRRHDSFYLHRFYECLDVISRKDTPLSPQKPDPDEVGIYDYDELHDLNPHLERGRNWSGVFAISGGKQSKTGRLMRELFNTSDTVTRKFMLPKSGPSGSQDCFMEYARDGMLLNYYNLVYTHLVYKKSYFTKVPLDIYKHTNAENACLMSKEDTEIRAWKLMEDLYGPSSCYALEISMWWDEQPWGYQGPFKMGIYKYINVYCTEGPDAVWIEISADGSVQEISVVPRSYMTKSNDEGRVE